MTTARNPLSLFHCITSVAVDQPTTSGEFEENGSQGGLPSGAVTGIIISTAVIAGVITVIVVSFLLKKKRLKQQEL